MNRAVDIEELNGTEKDPEFSKHSPTKLQGIVDMELLPIQGGICSAFNVSFRLSLMNYFVDL